MIRQTVRQRCSHVIATIYQQLYDAVHNPENGYNNPSAIMNRTPEQIESLIKWPGSLSVREYGSRLQIVLCCDISSKIIEIYQTQK